MMNSRERVLTSHNHKQPERVAIGFSGYRSSGINVIAYAKLRKFLGLEKKPIRVYDTVQQLAIVDEDILELFGADTMYITNLVSKLVNNKLNPANSKNYLQHKQDIDQVLAFIESNYADKICLNDLTGIAHISKYYFLKLFKKHIGLTPYEYLINFRMNKAKELLRNSELSIAEISTRVGFLDESSFIKRFKETSGYTPLGYRKYA